jgi:hypothetical protein
MNAIPPTALSIAGLAHLPRFVVWHEELRNGKPTKVPYDPKKMRMAKSDDPATWGTRADADAVAPRIVGANKGGIGIQLGDIGDGRALGGIDLDTCRNAGGNFDSWAIDLMERLGTYAEISQSCTGAKLFFIYDPADLPQLRAAMAPSRWGKQWKRGCGEHPPAIELYLGNRYFTVTEDLVSGMPTELATVPLDGLLRLIRSDGPAFVRHDTAAEKRRQKSRSEAAFRIGARAKRNGGTYTEMVDLIRQHPETAEWCREKGDAAGGRELRRIWERVPSDTVDSFIDELNAKYMVVNEGGKAIICAPGYDPVLKRRRFDRLSFDDLGRLYMNRKIVVGTDHNGNPIMKNLAYVWLHHPRRRQYIHGVIFDPSGAPPPDGVLNLWEGFTVKPARGDWTFLREHIRNIICAGDLVHYNYLIRWLARLVQFPAEQGEVAVVLKGGEGTGKGTLAKALLHITGHHGFAISNAKHLVGNFNGHLRDAIFLFADEAFYAGDKQHVGTLKSLITEPYLTVEAKFQNAVQTPNRLHVLLASNEEWVVPASLDARRFLVLDVSSARANDHAYFAAIRAQMEAGGHAAMLYDLLDLDIRTFNVRAVPVTDALQQQRKLSLLTPEAWWRDCLERGYVFRSRLGLESHFATWHEELSTELLFASYSEFADKRRERHPMSREAMGKFIVRMGCKPRRLYNKAVGEHLADIVDIDDRRRRVAKVIEHQRPPGYSLGDLDKARDAFTKATGLIITWDPSDVGRSCQDF